MSRVSQSKVNSDDVHQQATLLRSWDQEYTQLRAGEFTGSVSILSTTAINLFIERMNRAVFQTGALTTTRLAFGLPLRTAGLSRICGEEGSANSLVVFSGSSGFEFLSPDAFEFLGIEIDTVCSSDPVFLTMVRALQQFFSSDRRSISIEPVKAAKLGRVLTMLLAEDWPGAQLDAWPDQAATFNRSLVGWLLDILQSAVEEEEPVVARHWETISAIGKLVKNSLCCPISVAELTVELGLSRRTLQNACNEIIGTSPVQYLRALRLSEARRMLQSARSVTEVATHFGFWHLSYFSRDYHTMFGELPSKTLQRWRARDRFKDIHPRQSQRPFRS